MADYGYMYSGYSSSSNGKEPPTGWTESKFHGRPFFDANEQGMPLTGYIVERVHSSDDGAYKYVEVTNTEQETLTRGQLEGAPAEVLDLYTKILNEVSEPLQELHVTHDHNHNYRYRGSMNPSQNYPLRFENSKGHNEDRTRLSGNLKGPSSTSYWRQSAIFKKLPKPINNSHVSDYRNGDLPQPRNAFEAEPSRFLTGPGTARQTATTWGVPKGRDTSLSSPTSDIDEAMMLLLAAARSSKPNSYGYGGIRDHSEAVRPSGVPYLPNQSHFNGSVSSYSGNDVNGEPAYVKDVARPSSYATQIGQDKSPLSFKPNNDEYDEVANNREDSKPSSHTTASGFRKHNPPLSVIPNKNSYDYSINNNEAANPSGIGQANYSVTSMPKRDSYGEPNYKSGVLKPSLNDRYFKSESSNPTRITSFSPGSSINAPLASHVPGRTASEEPLIKNQAIKPSSHNTASAGSKFSKEAAKPTHPTTDPSIRSSNRMHISSAPTETYPAKSARTYGSSADTIDSREAAKLYGIPDGSFWGTNSI